ncbi:hypothetical protein M426DRAFT_257953 [Hypoxylon sp. CI-4A]|nr:hypothetical protein M426DRAFT_257953 [Hypoxylon sp. CI-4A]
MSLYGKTTIIKDDKDDLSRDDEYYDENPITLESIGRQRTLITSITSSYASEWTVINAFRELVQNWRDGIIKSYNIRETAFHVTCEERDDEIVYTAIDSSRELWRGKEPLGYIRWSRRSGRGIVDITNRHATLQPCHLDMGGTSKKTEVNQAGAHGEGLKVALLILMRNPQNVAVCCYSGGFLWSFDFTTQRRLVAYLTKITPSTVNMLRNEAVVKDQGLAPFVALPHSDVQFLIGMDTNGRNADGFRTARNEVTRKQFQMWTSAALFLQNIDEYRGVVRTSKGDLIMDPKFSGNIYMKGLLLQESAESCSTSMTGRPLKYSYNFATGNTNRDRVSTATTNEESAAILSIWDQAILSREELIGKLHEILNSVNPDYADVANAESLMSKRLKDHVKRYLLREFKGKWFYAPREKSQNTRFDEIIQGLNREPFELKEEYWRILKGEGLRTAGEEEQKQFLAAQSVPPSEDSFSKGIFRLIQAGLRSCNQTKSMAVQFVEAGGLQLDSFYAQSQNLFKVHEKWLTIEGVSDRLGTFGTIPMASILYTASRQLLEYAMLQVPLNRFVASNGHPPRWSQQRAIRKSSQRILEYIQIHENLVYEIERHQNYDTHAVKWNINTGWVHQSLVRIQFHRESSCSHIKNLLLTGCPVPRCLRPPFNQCHENVVLFGAGETCLRVQRDEKYFVMLSNQSIHNSFTIVADNPRVVHVVDKDLLTPEIQPNDETKTYTLEDEIESFDLTVPRDWFNGTNSIGTKAIIGVEKNAPMERVANSFWDDEWLLQ